MSLLKISSGERDSGSFKILHNTLHSWCRVPCSFFLSQFPYQHISWSSRELSSWFLPFSSMTAAEGTRGSTENEKKNLHGAECLALYLPLFPTCVHGYTQSVHMSSAKIRGKTSAEAGVQRISPPYNLSEKLSVSHGRKVTCKLVVNWEEYWLC